MSALIHDYRESLETVLGLALRTVRENQLYMNHRGDHNLDELNNKALEMLGMHIKGIRSFRDAGLAIGPIVIPPGKEPA
jgi:hypothetical protein